MLAQQGKGLFFSAFGTDAPVSYGRFSPYQAFYFEIPVEESKTVFLRVFDADVGGAFDEKHDRFNTSTRFLVLGGASAGRLYGGKPEIETALPEWDSSDILYEKTFGQDKASDGKWIALRDLPLSKGFASEGFARFVLLVISGKGDDSNFFDLALSYDRFAKTQVPGSRAWVYTLSLRNPSLLAYNWESFQGQLVLKTEPGEPLELHTFDMDDVPISVELDGEPLQGETSGDGIWVGNKLDAPASGIVRMNFFGRDFNNTFGFLMLGRDMRPVPLFLPIADYVPGASPVAVAAELPATLPINTAPVAVPEKKQKEPEAEKKSKRGRKEEPLPEKAKSEEPAAQKSATPPPRLIASDFEGGDCMKITLRADVSRVPGLQNAKATWFIDDKVYTGMSVPVEFDSAGYKKFKLQLVGMVENRPKTFEIVDSVRGNMPPSAWAGADRVTVPGRYVVFDGTVSEDPDGKITRYEWDLGDGQRLSGARIDYVYRKGGTYQVKLKVTDDASSPCSEAEAIATVIVNEPPVARIKAPAYVNLGELFTLDGTGSRDPDGSIVDYLWEIGRDTTLSGPTVQYALRSGGTVPVTLTVRDNANVSNSIAKANVTIRANQAPVARAGDDKRVSPGKPASFAGSRSYDPDGSISSYEWDFGNGDVLKGANVSYGFEKPGIYAVTLTVTDNTGKARSTDTMSVWVNAPPVPVIEGNTVLADGRLKLSGASSTDSDGEIVAYEWNIGDGRVFTGPELNAVLRNPGTYRVRLTVSDDSKTASSIQSTEVDVRVNRLPEAVISGPGRVSPGEENRFSGVKSNDSDGKITSYEWDFGDGTTAVGAEASHTFHKPGLYQVTLKVRDDSGLEEAIDVVTQEVRVNAPPVMSVEGPKTIQAGQTFTVDASSSYDPEGKSLKFSWMIDGQWKSGGPVREITYRSGMDSVLVMADDGEGIKSSKAQFWYKLPINRQPIAVASPAEVKSERPTVIFSGAGSYDPDGDKLKYYWDFGDGRFAEGITVSHMYKTGGRYKATLLVDDQRGAENSQASDTVYVSINRPPTVYFEVPEIICIGAPVSYSASNAEDPDGDPLLLRWSFGDGSTSSEPQGTYIYRQEGRYQVSLTVDDRQGLSNSSASYAASILVVGAPVADAGPDRTVCRTDVVEFDAGASRFPSGMSMDAEWDFGDGKKGFGISESHKYAKPGVYQVTLTLKSKGDAGCEVVSTDVMKLTVLPELKAEFSVPDFVALGDTLVLDPSASYLPEYKMLSITWLIDEKPFITWDYREDGRGAAKSSWVAAGLKAPIGGSTSPDLTAQGKLPVSRILLPGGEHRVTLILNARSESNCNEARKTVLINVQNRPDVAISDIPVLAPRTPFMFSVKEASGRVAQLAGADWDFGDGKKASGFFVSHSYAEPGKYKLAMTARMGRSNAATYTLTKEVLVNAAPSPAFDIPLYAFLNVPLELNAKNASDPDGSITSYTWTISDGGKYTGSIAAHTFTKKGPATVTLTVKDNSSAANATQSVSKQIIIQDVPSFTLNLESAYCIGTPINLLRAGNLTDADSTRARFFIGDRSISFLQAKSFAFQFPGMYSVRIEPAGTNSTGGAPTLAGVRKQVIINAPPQIFAEVPMTINLNMANANALFDCTKAFDPNGDPVNAVWDMGDGNRKPGKTIRHLYKNTGTYRVTLTLSDDRNSPCSTTTQTYTVKVIRE
jgi:PKD repeat protein